MWIESFYFKNKIPKDISPQVNISRNKIKNIYTESKQWGAEDVSTLNTINSSMNDFKED